MFNKKSLILGAASVLLASGLAGCGGANRGDLCYWCPNQDNDIMEKIVEEFKKDNPDYASKSIVRDANYGEGDAYNALHGDLRKAADVMLMADDNIRAGVAAEEIASVDADKAAFVKEVGESAVNATSVDGKMYGYAYRADNSPMPFYNKNVFSDVSQLRTLEGMLKGCKDAGKKFYLDMGNGWYNQFLLSSAGAKFTVGKDSKGAEVMKTDVMNHSEDVGELMEAMKDLYNEYKDTWISSSKDADIEAAFADNSAGIAFLWNDTVNITNAGGNVGVTLWPTIKVGTANVQLTCFRSYKAVVCKENEDAERGAFAKVFAKYLASKKAQQMRIELSYGPANLELQATDEVKKLEFVTKANEMFAKGLTVEQAPNVTQAFWTPIGNLGKLIIDGTSGVDAWGDYDGAAQAAEDLLGNTGWEAL